MNYANLQYLRKAFINKSSFREKIARYYCSVYQDDPIETGGTASIYGILDGTIGLMISFTQRSPCCFRSDIRALFAIFELTCFNFHNISFHIQNRVYFVFFIRFNVGVWYSKRIRSKDRTCFRHDFIHHFWHRDPKTKSS